MKLAAAAGERALARPDKSLRAALLYGPNRSAIAEAAERAIAARLGANADPFALTKLNEDEIKRDRARLNDALAAQSLLGAGGARVVRLRVEGDSAAESVLDALSRLEAEAGDAAFLLIEAGDLAARSKIRAAFEAAAAAAAIPFYEDSPEALAAFAGEVARALGLKLEPAAMARVLACAPADRLGLRGELEKLALYAHGAKAPLQEAEIETLLAQESEAELDEATRLALAGEAGPAVEALLRSATAPISAIRALERRLLRLMEAQQLMAEGTSAADVAQKLKPPVFWKERATFAQELKRWPRRRALWALDRLWEAQTQAMRAGAAQDLIAAATFRAIASGPHPARESPAA